MARENDVLILVNENDEELGWEEKVKCHLNGGVLHRAFSIFIFNDKGELLLQKRASNKMLWGGFWSNSCCSHPRKGDETMESAKIRLMEELGFSTEINYLYKFIYKADFKNIGTEYENCHVFYGYYNQEPAPDKEEIEEYKWVPAKKMAEMIELNPEKFTPWFKMEWNEIITKYKSIINSGE